jgi:uncharacterized membrane protein
MWVFGMSVSLRRENAMLIFTFLGGITFLVAVALTWNAPLLAAMWLFRARPMISSAVVATGFAVATAYMLWKMEWFDVWRHGIPSASYLLGGYLPYIAGIGAIGWFSGGLVARRSHARG